MKCDLSMGFWAPESGVSDLKWTALIQTGGWGETERLRRIEQSLKIQGLIIKNWTVKGSYDSNDSVSLEAAHFRTDRQL